MKSFKQFHSSDEVQEIKKRIEKMMEETEKQFEIPECMIIDEQSVLLEKLITFGGRAYPKSGQVVILAGGAGSGKGFAISNLLGIEGKIFDVDALKHAIIDSEHLAQRVKEKTGIDVKKLSLKNPGDVKTLHQALADPAFAYDKKHQAQAFTAISTIKFTGLEHKPNLIFDVTLKDITKFTNISDRVQMLGYPKENIHLVWVLADVEVARAQNLLRDRVIPDDILVQTHEGVSLTMKKLVSEADYLRKYMDGDMWIAFSGRGEAHLKSGPLGGGFITDAKYYKIKAKGQKPMSPAELAKVVVDDTDLVSKIKKMVPKINSW